MIGNIFNQSKLLFCKVQNLLKEKTHPRTLFNVRT